MKQIRFYKVNEPYGFFSNFSPHPIFIEGEIWTTVEHYFQASKFDNIELRTKIKLIDSPMKAASEGRDSENKKRKDWDVIKEKIMFDALLAKFMQHPHLRFELLNTNKSIIIEDTINDNYWGNGGNDTGKNRLGILIMEVREKIKTYSEDKNIVLPPWIAFPSISQYDIFWRMGLGEEYLTSWSKYFLNTDINMYKINFPENTDWEGIYD